MSENGEAVNSGSTQDAVFQGVRKILQEALDVDPKDVKPEARLTWDLGAESIDLLDIVFRLEREFQITAARDAFFPSHVAVDPTFVEEGRLTSAGLAEVKRCMPWVDLSQFEKKPVLTDFPSVLSVGDVCRYVSEKLASGEASLSKEAP